MIDKPDLKDYFMTGKVDRIFHQKYCYDKALRKHNKHFPGRIQVYNR